MLLADVQEVVKDFAVAVSLYRPGAVQTNEGYENRAAGTTVTIQSVIQPIDPKTLARLPEGERATDWRQLWSLTQLKLNDEVTYGDIWVIEKINDWTEAGNFWNALAKRKALGTT